MTQLVKCERCGTHHESWTHFRRKLPDAKVKKRVGFGKFRYGEADLCKPCARDLNAFMNGNSIPELPERGGWNDDSQ